MPQIGAGKVAARVTFTGLVQGFFILFEAFVFDGKPASGSEQSSSSGIAAGHDAIEHIDAVFHREQNLFRRSGAHQIARLLFRHLRNDKRNDPIKVLPRFADTQTADRVAFKIEVNQPLQRPYPQIFQQSALHNAELGIVAIDAREVLGVLLFAMLVTFRACMWHFSRKGVVRDSDIHAYAD